MTHAVNRDGLTFHFNIESEFEEIYHDIFVDGEYDFDLHSPTPRIIDCGAHIGISVLRVKQRYPQAQVIAFEPNPMTYALLCENVKYNQLTNVELINHAVTAEPGSVSFHISTDGWGMRDSVAPKRWHDGKKDRLVTVTSSSLRPYLSEDVDLLKLDIEGSETSVLLSIQKELRHVKNIVLEYHSDIANPANRIEVILDVLDKAGLTTQVIVQDGNHITFDHIVRNPQRWVVLIRASRPLDMERNTC